MKLYLVRWLHDYYYRDTAFRGGAPDCPSVPRLVRAFLDPVAAEAYRRQLNQGALAPPPETNPFLGFRKPYYFEHDRFGGLQDLTSMPEAVFDDWLRDHGLVPPQPTRYQSYHDCEINGRDWAGWWETNVPTMTDWQRARVWQALDRLRFFETVETEMGD